MILTTMPAAYVGFTHAIDGMKSHEDRDTDSIKSDSNNDAYQIMEERGSSPGIVASQTISDFRPPTGE
jgi:hypothetical protein